MACVVFVSMRAFGQDGQLREVEIPSAEWDAEPTTEGKLELVFQYGQNDFQPRPCPSVSVGDVILLDGNSYQVDAMGFSELALGNRAMAYPVKN